MPNSAPAGSSLTRTVPRSYTLHKSDFGFSDSDGNAFKAIVVTTLPGAGTLYYDANGTLGGGPTAVVAGQTISAADILAGKLTFVAPAGVSGANYDHFTFQVQDDGGTAGGGVDLDPTPNTLTFDLIASAATPPVFDRLTDLAALSAPNGFKIQGGVHDQAGISVSSAGDVNGDGFADIMVGAIGNGLYTGGAYVIFGKANGFGNLIDLTGLSAMDGFKIQGEAFGDEAGLGVSSAGDINGDGFADLIVGARLNDGGGVSAGAAYVVFGKSGGFGSTITLAGLPANDGFKIQGDAASDYAGFSVSSAGDVNGDGFADIIVGAWGNDSGGYSAGAAYVIFGKSGGFGSLIDLTGLSATDGFRIQGDVAGDNAGISVSSAGDVNGDGFADILVGARDNSSGGSSAGAAYIVFGKSGGFGSLIDLTGLSAADGFKIQGDVASDGAGSGVSSAGDVNGDGFADIIIGALGNDSGGSAAGAAYVIFGKAGGFGSLIDLGALSAADGFKIQGDAADDRAGISVSSAGDVNGDGFADLIVGARLNNSAGYSGAAYVIFGKSGGFGSLIDLAALPAVDGFKIQGNGFNEDAGSSVSAAGDVNGDGFADLIVGAPGDRSGGAYAGAAYVIFGRANLNVAPSGTDRTLSIPRNYVLHVGDFGFSDTNGHAFKALVVTTLPGVGTLYYDSNGGLAGGRTAVVAGQTIEEADILAGKLIYVAPAGASGTNYDHFTFQVQDDGGTARGGVDLDPTPDTLTFDLVASAATPPTFGSLIDLGALSAASGFKIQGDLAGDYAGLSVSSAGDVNGDGFADLLVGAWQNDSGGDRAGAAYLIFGKASGFGSLIDLTGLSPADGFKIQGALAGDLAGRSVSSAGDVNGDGFADIVVGAFGNDSGGSYAGAAYVIFGKASGFGGLINLTGLAATDGFKIQGDFPNDNAGFSVSSTGDVNGDGFSDIIVGAPNNSSGGFGAGAAYVIFGKSGGFGSLIDLTGLSAADGFKIQGDANADGAGVSVSSAGDVNGDGFADILVGADDNDSGGSNAGAAYVIFGKAGGFGSVIDLAGLTSAEGFKIQGDVAHDLAGFSVSSAGDVNGDGFADILVGAPGNASGGGYNAGAAYLIFGKADGFGSLIDLTNLSQTDGFKIQGDLLGDQAGVAVSSAGDVNGDGFADILIGANLNDSGGNQAGAAYVIFGKAGGFGTLIDLGNLSPANGFKIQGETADDTAGLSVSSAGDINGDGFDDIIVGAYTNDSGGDNAGAAYVIFGRANNNPPVAQPDAVATDEATILNGNVLSDNGSGADSDVDGGPPFSVTAVNGNAAAVGNQITLASGALLTLNANGTFSYDPHHAFDATPAAGSGASNTPALDSFTYTLTGGGTATVTVTISGLDSNDVLLGTGGADVLVGGAGNDMMSGGLGDDIYYVQDAGDSVIESAGQGNDRIFTSVSYTLAAGVEIETLSTSDAAGTSALNLAGNEFAQTIIGNAGANTLTSGGGSDYLVGLGGDDILIGNADAASTLEGGIGNDWYYVNRTGDSVVERAGEGSDDRAYASVSFTLSAGQEIEQLNAADATATTALSLTGNDLSQVIFGNAGANVLTSGGGADYLVGLGGDDVLVGNAATASTLQGGTGNDWYYIYQTGDSLVEFAGEGNDRIITTVSYTLSGGQEIETLIAADPAATTAINLTGNALDQVIFGNAGANVLTGGGGHDLLAGAGGDDILIGNADGASTLQGGTGDDWYYIFQTGDSLVEFAGEGNDRIISTVSYTLSPGVEVETLAAADQSGTTAIDLAGNDYGQVILGTNGVNVLSGNGGADQIVGLGGDDVLLGGDGDDQLNGGDGHDVLNGGAGADLFVFADALGSNNVDTIQDFTSGTDRIVLDHNVFTGLSTGVLPASAFVTGTAAQDADDRIIYDNATGNLYFDADGNGAGAAMLFATLANHPTVTASDFVAI